VVGQIQNGCSTSSATKLWEANQQNPSGTAAHAAAKVRMYWCNLILQAITNRKPGQVGASMYGRSQRRAAGVVHADSGCWGRSSQRILCVLRSLFVMSEFLMRVLIAKNLLGYRLARDYGARTAASLPVGLPSDRRGLPFWTQANHGRLTPPLSGNSSFGASYVGRRCSRSLWERSSALASTFGRRRSRSCSGPQR